MNFQTKLKQQLEAQGYTVVKIIRLSKNGFPDLLAMKEGEPDRWIECKEGKDTLKPLQKLRIDELIKLGKIAYCIHNTKGIIYGININ